MKGENTMNNIEIEQLKNDLALKVGLLENKIKSGEINDDTAVEAVELFKEYEKEGTTLVELKLLYDDVKMALN